MTDGRCDYCEELAAKNTELRARNARLTKQLARLKLAYSHVAKGKPPLGKRGAKPEEILEEIKSLFEVKATQHGSSQIAKTLGRNESMVRKQLDALVQDGWLTAEGTTRDRRFRRVQ